MAANRWKPEEERKWPTLESLVVSGLSGAATGLTDFGPEQWKYEAGIAFLGSLAEDALKGDDYRWLAALGAATGAGLYEKYGKARFKEKFGDKMLAQGAGKFASKAIKEAFGSAVEDLTESEAKEFLEGFMRAIENADKVRDFWEQQFNDWFGNGDEDPIL